MCLLRLHLLVSRCKRIVENGRSKGSKKLNELEDQFTKASDEFREINEEIYSVLPAFYELRRSFYGQMFQTLFATVAKFHEECTTITDDLAQTMYCNFDIFGTISRVFTGPTPPLTCRVMCSTSCLCLLDADWWLQYDVVTNSCL